MHGLGNDFIVIDNVNNSVNLKKINIQKLSNRHTGIGFDQMLVLEKTLIKNIDYKYRIFNANGSEVQQCGNGARCIALYLKEKKLIEKPTIKVETINGVIQLDYKDKNNITVNMGKPIFELNKIPLHYSSKSITYEINGYQMGVLSMGNPHAVIILKNIEDIDIASIAKGIQSSTYFPDSVNVGFMEICSKTNISLRVYERGVGETNSCGSGACAAVVYGKIKGLLDGNVTVKLNGGFLKINYEVNNDVMMSGPAEKVFEGSINI